MAILKSISIKYDQGLFTGYFTKYAALFTGYLTTYFTFLATLSVVENN